MRTLYLECNMGAAGDMIMSALLELIDNPWEFIDQMNHLGLKDVHVVKEAVSKCGIMGTRVNVHIHGTEEESTDMFMSENDNGQDHVIHNEANQKDGHEYSKPCADHDKEQSHSHTKQCAKYGEGHEYSHTKRCADDDEGHEHSHTKRCADDDEGHEHSHTKLYADHNEEHNHSHHNHSHHTHGHHEHSHEIDGTHDHTHSTHHHTGMAEIKDIIDQLPVSSKVKEDAYAIYQLIANAESKAHGKPVSQVHFHEVGAMDAIADIIGICILMEIIAPDQVIASPIHVGSGFVKCSHGILPVPAPATAHILLGIPTYSGNIKGELCTPTGAAVLRHFVSHFGTQPVMTAEKIGYGMGHKDFDAANCIRAFYGVMEQSLEDPNQSVAELSCNLDDMTAEEMGYAAEILLKEGALDVFFTSIQMKKNRPGTLLTCICTPERSNELSVLMLKHTTSLGIRKKLCERYALSRQIHSITTKYGEINLKVSEGYGITKYKPEYDDIADAAKVNNCSFSEVSHETVKAAKEQQIIRE